MNIKDIKKNKSTEELIEFGIINIDKPSGPTSFDVCDFVREKLKLKKASHFGTLDPKVTGVLPIALSRACKLTGYFISHDKEYVGVARFHEEVELKKIQEIIGKKFSGKILQKPPVKSRVKREEREREIVYFELLEKDKKDVLFKVACQGGTYIRKLIDDLGKEMDIGAHMLELRRIRAGIFSEESKEYPSINLYDFEKAVENYKKGNDEELRKIIIPAEIVSEIYPIAQIKNSEKKRLLTGKPLTLNDLKKEIKIEKEKTFCGFCEENFIGMYKVLKDKDIFAKPEWIMQPLN